MTWWELAPTVLYAVSVLFVPGMLVMACVAPWGVRTIAVAPAISVAVIGVAAIAAPMLGVPWGPVPVLAVTGVLALIGFALRIVFEPKPRRLLGQSAFLVPMLSILVGSALLVRRLVFALGAPENISQTFDNLFHLNAIRLALDTGDASSFHLGEISGVGFYPAGWHAVVALVADVASSVPAAVNATNLVIASVVWASGCVLLAMTAFPASRVAVVVAGVLASAFGAFPFLLLFFGVLYPNFLSYALVPVGLALMIRLLGLAGDEVDLRSWSWWRDAVLLLVVAGGTAIAHPGGALALIALGMPLLVVWYVRAVPRAARTRPISWRRVVPPTAVLVTAVLFTYIVWRKIRPPVEAAGWPPRQSQSQALGEALTVAPLGSPMTLLVAALVVAGILAAIFDRRKRWVVGPFAVVAVLFVIVSGGPAGEMRDFLTGVWYNDSYRLASLLPVPGLLVATSGAIWIVELVQERGRRALAALPRWAEVGVAVVVLCVLVVLSQGEGVRQVARMAHANSSYVDDARLLSTDELALLEQVDDLVDEEGVIAVNPWTGASLAYALADRQVTQMHIFTPMTPAQETIVRRLRAVDVDPDVCEAVRESGVGYALDFGTLEVNGGNNDPKDYWGVEGLREGEHLTLLAEEGDARLFAIEGC